MSNCQQALSEDHPWMIAWQAFLETEEAKSAIHWCLRNTYDDGRPVPMEYMERHVQGALWLAFIKGIEIAKEGSNHLR